METGKRAKSALTPHHFLAYMCDPQHMIADKAHPSLSAAQEEQARDVIFQSSDDLVTALAAYETQNLDLFPKVAFNTTLITKFSSRKYWEYIEKIAREECVKKFCRLLRVLACCQPSSAEIERLFSSGDVHIQNNYSIYILKNLSITLFTFLNTILVSITCIN